jgi:hypothetical protein
MEEFLSRRAKNETRFEEILRDSATRAGVGAVCRSY